MLATETPQVSATCLCVSQQVRLPRSFVKIASFAPSLDGLEAGYKRASRTISAMEHPIQSISTRSLFTASEGNTERKAQQKPAMVRNKSGEPLRPALRSAAQRHDSGVLGTPSSSKAVRFDYHLEHVQHFLQVDRPLALSAVSSPVKNGTFANANKQHADQSPSPYELKLAAIIIPSELLARKSQLCTTRTGVAIERPEILDWLGDRIQSCVPEMCYLQIYARLLEDNFGNRRGIHIGGAS